MKIISHCCEYISKLSGSKILCLLTKRNFKKVTKGALLNERQCFGIFAEQFYLTFYGFLIGFDAKRSKIAFHSQSSNENVFFFFANESFKLYTLIAYLLYNMEPTTLQSMVNAKLSQQWFGSAISKSVSRRFQTIPRNLYIIEFQVSSPLLRINTCPGFPNLQ